ncbi:murein biosynthesis integral membrane protein MurJ [Thalassobaculum litoreum]|uniref:Putative peptidoglycan lipid II flippase n=1 Tax=Thalassobaculum litoreum DSM 18839 TaxID=1123362 RepID=A0A8G2BI45_9PROT|nr:lipid II flippase MurJ [Thalassobaculum litoreum]SDF74785.1 putative peptidoglycan lipid II flippase [Thalassobaculum litoreum DSM 18839]
MSQADEAPAASGMDDRAIARAGATIAILSVVAKSSAFLREAVIAMLYGRGPEVDAFFVALALPVFLVQIVAGSFQIAAIPALLAAKRGGDRRRASALATSGAGIVAGVIAGAAILCAAFAPLYLPAVAPGYSARTITLATDMLWIMSLFAVMGGLAYAGGAVLTAERRFALPAIAPVLTPLAMALLLIGFRDSLGVSALAWGAVIGTLAEAAIVLSAARRLGYRPAVSVSRADLADLLRRWGPLFLATLLLSGAGLIDQLMAARLGEGAASALGYGAKLVLAGLHVVTTALGISVLPAYAENALEDPARLFSRLRRHLVAVILLAIPGVGIAWLLSEPVIALLYQRGAFTAEDTKLVAQVLSAYATQLPAFAAVVILVRAAAVLNLGGVIPVAAAVNIVLTIALNALFMRYWGVVGIALATAPAFAVTGAVLYLGILRDQGRRKPTVS